MTTPENRLAKLGITLPEPVAAVANYVPYVIMENQLFVSGQVSVGPEGLIKGTLGDDMDIAAGQAAARLCGINLISQCRAAVSELSNIKRVVKLGGFVCATRGFTDIPLVINGCSDLMVDVFGDAGRHARSAVSCPVLPLGVAVEIDGVFEIG